MTSIIKPELDIELLKKYGAKSMKYSKGELIFNEGNQAKYLYLVLKGDVKMFNLFEDGSVFIQQIFSNGRPFGGPPLIGDFPYPASAEAITDIELLAIGKNQFENLLLENPKFHLKFTQGLAERIHYKARMAAELSSNHAPEDRILKLFNYLKHDIYKIEQPFEYQVELTRQQIADLVGLRVETVIKAIKRMEQNELLKIINRKVFV